MMARVVGTLLSRARPGVLEGGQLGLVSLEAAYLMGKLLLPFLAMNFLLAIGIQVAQHGFRFKPSMLKLKPERLNPVGGFKRLFSTRSLVEFLKSVLKFSIIAWVAWTVVSPRVPALLSTLKIPLGQGIQILQDTLFVLYRNIMLAMLVIALADLFYQRKEFENSIMMTKQEVSDEQKQAEGNPQIKAHQRSLMMAVARKRMMVEVPRATVVITNPTHVAVALRYDESNPAPICVAKGLDFLAQRIKAIAREAGVTVVENPPLARSLYRGVEVGKPIPHELFQAVAQVLAYVYRLKGAA
jgi:flagellar biosynthetic protein FlhB